MLENIRRHYPPALELLSLGLALLSIMYVTYHFGHLPETIPTHFDFTGTPDSWGSKYMLIGLLVIQLYTYFQGWILNYFLIIKPQDYKEALRFVNIPFVKKEDLTPEQVQGIKRHMARMMFTLFLSINVLFLYLIFSTIQTAYGHWSGLGSGFIAVVIIVLIVPFIYMWKAYRVAKPER